MSILRPDKWVGLSSFLAATALASVVGAQAPVPRLTPRLTPRPAPADPQPAPAEGPAPKRVEKDPAPAPSGPTPAAPAPTPARPAQPTPAPSAPVPSGAPGADPAGSALGGFRPPVLPSYPGLAPPAGYVLRKKYNVPLLVGGGLTLAVTWGTSIAYGSSRNFENGLGALAVPILGPWIAMGQRDFTCDVETTGTNVSEIRDSQDEAESCIANQTATAGFLVGLGVGQLVGTSLLTVGLLDRRKSWVRMDLAGVDLHLNPSVAPGLTGLMATGSF